MTYKEFKTDFVVDDGMLTRKSIIALKETFAKFKKRRCLVNKEGGYVVYEMNKDGKYEKLNELK